MTTKPQKSVFIADEADRLLLKFAFDQHIPAFNLIFAEDGSTLLAALAQQATEPCLLILDLTMSRLNGFEARQQVRHDPTHASVPVAILTTSDEVADRKRADELGLLGF